MVTQADTDTICAIVTPPGRSGVGIIRVSGPLCRSIAQRLLLSIPSPRHASYCAFYDQQQQAIDQGLALFFPSPNSFTGEDVLELQGHGGYHVLNLLMREVLSAGARLARPGEFSERAFLNDKLDLAQAEAIADLIDSSSEQAARSALRTLQGEFSRLIDELSASITELRVFVEAAIDFSEEEIDFLSEGNISGRLTVIIVQLDAVLEQARQGSILKEGMSVVIAGKPNAGKSSLLNALAGKDSAIVTAIAGTTRDILNEEINIDGMPLHITDTAGLRASEDPVEQEGIRRALGAISRADRILLVVDSATESIPTGGLHDYLQRIGFAQLTEALDPPRLSIVYNKIDLRHEQPEIVPAIAAMPLQIKLSAREKTGMDLLRQHLKDCVGFQATDSSSFIARSRHIDALHRARANLSQAQYQLATNRAAELVAEDLRQAHRQLGEITGTFTTDDLLGRIFSSFCVGK